MCWLSGDALCVGLGLSAKVVGGWGSLDCFSFNTHRLSNRPSH
jgi:hypothetical protein